MNGFSPLFFSQKLCSFYFWRGNEAVVLCFWDVGFSGSGIFVDSSGVSFGFSFNSSSLRGSPVSKTEVFPSLCFCNDTQLSRSSPVWGLYDFSFVNLNLKFENMMML